MTFEIIGDLMKIEVIATGSAIRDLERLRKTYGDGRWRKMKGVATVLLANGRMRQTELH